MTEIIIGILVGLLLIFLGYRIGWKYDIKLVHGYHYVNVAPQDKPKFCRLLGIGNLIVGGGCLLSAVLNYALGGKVGYYLGAVVIAIGIIEMLFTIIKYNGSLFGRLR